MKVIPTELPGVLVIEPRIFGDSRGYFFESYNQEAFEAAGITDRFVQDNHSRSARGTLRGLHYQLPHTQAKLCRVIEGEVWDVAVDVRRGSPHFGKWVGVTLSAENKRQIYVPPGFAHGFVVLSPSADFLYKCDDYYYPAGEQGVAWDDPAIGIQWPLGDLKAENLIRSTKDITLPQLANIPLELLPPYIAS